MSVLSTKLFTDNFINGYRFHPMYTQYMLLKYCEL